MFLERWIRVRVYTAQELHRGYTQGMVTQIRTLHRGNFEGLNHAG